MEILPRDDGFKGSFYIKDNNDILAEMTYVWAGVEKIIIDHTDVSPVLKGQGTGKKMLLKLVEFARGKGLKIIPLCPFTKSVFDKSKELNDVL